LPHERIRAAASRKDNYLVVEQFNKYFKNTMSLYSSSYLKNLASSRSTLSKTKLFSESRRIETGFDIFLSHSFLDKEEVEGLYLELTDFGFKVSMLTG
jgi:hypothetical protein